MGKHYKVLKGFTLLEVLVSIAIIAVLFLPMLSFFSHSLKVNTNSKKMQRANMVASSAMEMAKSIEHISDMTKENGWVKDSDKDIYVYTKTEVKVDGDNHKYAYQITVDPTKYRENKKINSVEVSQIEALGSGSTVMAAETDSYIQTAISQFKDLYERKKGIGAEGSKLTNEQVVNKLKKTIRIEISNTGLQEGIANVHIFDEYTVDKSIGEELPTISSKDLYNENISYEKLRGVYLFYNYDLNGSGDILQNITVDNTIPASTWTPKFTVYALCQGTVNTITGDKDTSMIDVDGNGAKSSNSNKCTQFNISDPNIKLYSNFKYKLNNSGSICDAKSLKEIVNKTTWDRLSEITVTVYENQILDANKILTLTSTREE